jgi:myo-inositol-1(or 4)-monophosphatase
VTVRRSDPATRAVAADREHLADIAQLTAHEAAQLVSAGYRSNPSFERKAQHDLVTRYDLASQEMLVSRLESLSPGIPVVAEEDRPHAKDASTASSTSPGRTGLVWYVDPVDGTTNFVHGHPFWCVAVGLMQDDEPIVGAIVAPAIGLSWMGWVGDRATPGGTRRNGAPCSVSTVDAIADALVATGFPTVRDHAPDDNFDSFVRVKRAVQGVRRCGSAAIDLCLVADGTYDAYWERKLHAWDVVAGSALVLAAGGRVSALEGGTPDWQVGHLIASNGRIHDELADLVNG